MKTNITSDLNKISLKSWVLNPLILGEKTDYLPIAFAKKAFTLIEVLIVVSIVSLVASVAIPTLSNSKTVTQEAKKTTTNKLVHDAKTRYAIENTVADGRSCVIEDISTFLQSKGAPATITKLEENSGSYIVNLGTHLNARGVASPIHWSNVNINDSSEIDKALTNYDPLGEWSSNVEVLRAILGTSNATAAQKEDAVAKMSSLLSALAASPSDFANAVATLSENPSNEFRVVLGKQFADALNNGTLGVHATQEDMDPENVLSITDWGVMDITESMSEWGGSLLRNKDLSDVKGLTMAMIDMADDSDGLAFTKLPTGFDMSDFDNRGGNKLALVDLSGVINLSIDAINAAGASGLHNTTLPTGYDMAGFDNTGGDGEKLRGSRLRDVKNFDPTVLQSCTMWGLDDTWLPKTLSMEDFLANFSALNEGAAGYLGGASVYDGN